MAEKYYYYIDYGSGDVQINPHENNLNLEWIRGQLNDFITRKNLTGSFVLIDTEAVAAESYFIGSANVEAPIKIYQNGDIISGTLIYEGWATTEGLFDYDNLGNAISVTFNSFRTNDDYTLLVKFWKETFSFFDIYNTTVLSPNYNKKPNDFTLFENINNGIDRLDSYTFNGTNYVITAGTPLSTGNIGRIVGTCLGVPSILSVLLYIDNYTNTLRSKVYGGGIWTNYVPDYVVTTSLVGNWSIYSESNTRCILINENGRYDVLDIVGGVWTQTFSSTYSYFIGRYVSTCLVNPTGHGTALSAYINDETKSLQAYKGQVVNGSPLDFADVKKPCICGVDYTNDIIAMIDEESKLLRAIQYTYATGTWAEIAKIQTSVEVEPTISYSSTNVINLHDSGTGLTERYTFTPGTNTWALTGATTTIGNSNDGYSTVITTISSAAPTEYIAYIKSGSMVLMSEGNQSLQSYINKMSSNLRARESLINDPFMIPDSGSGSDIDVTNLVLANLGQVSDNYSDYIPSTEFEQTYTINQILQLAELFQQYWYLELSADPTVDYDIKFTQPDQFSSFGTDIIVDSDSVSLLRSRLYNENFKVNFEKLLFKNEFNTDFIGRDIRYGRENDIEIIHTFDVTTDFKFYKDYQLGLLNNFSKSGFMMFLFETGANVVEKVSAGTIFGGSTYIENSELSKAKIHDIYYKDYRYANKGTITINDIGNDATTFNTVRTIIEFPDYQTQLDDFPTSIANLDWGGGVKSFIMKLSTRLETDVTTISSRILDI